MSSVSKSAGAVPVHKSKAKAAQTRRGLLYALPDWLMIIVLFFVPIVLLVVMACSRWSLLGGNRGVNFPDNFVKVFENKLFWPSIWFTLEYTVIVTIFLLVLGLGMAMIVQESSKWNNVLRTCFLLPSATGLASASLLFYAVSTKDTDAHFEKSAGSLSLTRGIEAGPIEIDAHAQSRQRIPADPALLEMKWNGSGAIGILPSALDAKTLPPNDEPINATIQEESAVKEAGAGDTPSPTKSVPASFEAPNEPAADPNDPELADSLGLADPQEIDEGNCCVLAALDHTEVIDAANIEVAAANQPVRKSAIIAFPESIEVVFLPSGEVVAPTLLTLLGAKNTRNEIKKVTVVDPATTAKLRLYAVATNGSKTLEFDGDTLLAWRRLDIMQDVSYQIELEGFDRARDANIIAAAIESPQRLMTLRFEYYPYVPTTT